MFLSVIGSAFIDCLEGFGLSSFRCVFRSSDTFKHSLVCSNYGFTELTELFETMSWLHISKHVKQSERLVSAETKWPSYIYIGVEKKRFSQFHMSYCIGNTVLQ